MSTTTSESLIASVVQEVLQQLGPGATVGESKPEAPRRPADPAPIAQTRSPGVFTNVDEAVQTAVRAQRQLATAGLKVRDAICNLLKHMAKEKAPSWGRIEMAETKIGRLDHKVRKLELLNAVPGVEFLRTTAHSGDRGVSLDEAAPWGVIGVITPVTHSIPTLVSNAISMLAAGNAMVVNPHPSGANCAATAAAEYNRTIKQQFDIDPLICLVNPPTLKTAEQIFRHDRIGLLAVTGGPGVARAAMKQKKRAIVAGPGNPPVVVDETADFENAASSIIAGGGFDNNLLCIAEKEVFVVAPVFDRMMDAMRGAGAFELSDQQINRLAEKVFTFKNDHYALNKQYVGADTHVLGEAAGADVPKKVDLLFGETDQSSPFVCEEQMMPFIPFVRCRDFDEAVNLAIKYEHGFGHTAVIHSNNLGHITKMGQAMNVTLFVTNGPSTACLGGDGEGYASYSIATPTGEGVTNPLTFTRFRRFSVSGAMRIL